MPEPVTAADLTAAFSQLRKDLNADNEPHWRAIKDDLDKIGERLSVIETLLWQGDRLDEMEKRIIEIAQTVGLPQLAHPLRRAPGQ